MMGEGVLRDLGWGDVSPVTTCSKPGILGTYHASYYLSTPVSLSFKQCPSKFDISLDYSELLKFLFPIIITKISRVTYCFDKTPV